MAERLSTITFDRLRAARAGDPGVVRTILRERARRPLIAGDGRLFIVAADHTARGAMGVGSSPLAMADRYDLLERLAIALAHPGVDGVLGTPDIIDDLALLGLLEGKVVVGSINRGGLKSAAFELDDRDTGYDIDTIAASGLDFAKSLVRIDLDDHSTAGVLERAGLNVTRAAAAGIPIMLEPFMSRRVEGRVVNDLHPDAVMTSMAIAAGLGASSAYTWLKLPVVDDMARVMRATTLPTLLLGGDPETTGAEMFASWRDALGLPGVHGLVAGRTLLYPSDGDVRAAVDTAAALVHGTGRHG